MEQGDGGRLQSYISNITTPPTLCRVSPLFPKRQCSVLRIGDIWIPKIVASPYHFTKLYIHGVEDLFQIGNHLLKVELWIKIPHHKLEDMAQSRKKVVVPTRIPR
jgi:hypothetical protein